MTRQNKTQGEIKKKVEKSIGAPPSFPVAGSRGKKEKKMTVVAKAIWYNGPAAGGFPSILKHGRMGKTLFTPLLFGAIGERQRLGREDF